MNIKIRLAISLGMALIGVVSTFLLTENASEHRNIISILAMPAIVLFLATLAITSLFNIQNESSKMKYLIIVGIVMLTNIYLQYGQDKSLGAILGIAYVSAATIALIIRSLTLVKEKLYNRLPE
jgi:hypothetical protein